MKMDFRALLLGLGCIIVAGCQHPGPRFDPRQPSAASVGAPLQTVAITNRISPDWLKPSTDFFKLGPGDKLEIELLGDPTTRTACTVGPDGKIYFHLLPGLDVWGLTLSQTQDLLESELSKFIREKPQVSLTLRTVESRRVWLMGRLQTPGVYPLTTPTTLLEAISLAGGTLNMTGSQDPSGTIGVELADLRRSFLIRHGQMLPVDFQKLLKDGDLSQNVYLEPDDFIYLPGASADSVYVLGAVLEPKVLPYQEKLTLAAAIARSYGTVRDAYLSHVAIVRGSLTTPQIAIVDYRQIVKGQASDVELQPRDIVYVPYTPYRILSRYLDLITTTFVSSIAINEGSRAVLKNPPAATGILIPLGSRITVVQPGPPAIR